MKKIIRGYVAAYNNFDVPGMIRHLSDDIVFQNVSGGEVTLELTGKDAFREQAEQASKLFKSRKQTIDDIQILDNVAEVLINYEGALAQDLPNGLKAGDLLRLQGKSVFTFLKNKIVKLRDES
ncbi:MAG: nuclear transport factor 2 family protein [Cyclobacteriaceae bacterium]